MDIKNNTSLFDGGGISIAGDSMDIKINNIVFY